MPITRRRRANPPDEPENNNHLADQTSSAAESLAAEPASAPAVDGDDADGLAIEHTEEMPFSPIAPAPPVSNGDRLERQDYTPPIESGRRTPRGELFRRPPQPPPAAPTSFAASASLQAPTHEIALPLGHLLH